MSDRTVTVREALVGVLVASASSGPEPYGDKIIEAVETLRTMERNVSLIADLHGVDLDEPVGPERALGIVVEASGYAATGRRVTR